MDINEQTINGWSKALMEFGYQFATPEWVRKTIEKIEKGESVSMGAGRMVKKFMERIKNSTED